MCVVTTKSSVPQWALTSFLLATLITQRVHSQGPSIVNCPALEQGETTSIKATFDASNKASCNVIQLTEARFILVEPDATDTIICRQDMSACNTALNAQGCKCDVKSGDSWTFTLNLTYDVSQHENRTLLLSSNCLPSFPEGQNCTLKTKLAPTIAVGDNGLSDGEIAGIVVGIGIAVIIVVVLVVLIRRKKFTRTITVPTNVDVTQADVNAINNNTVADVKLSTKRKEIIITGTICEVNEAAKQVEKLIENNYVATISFSLHVDVTDNQLNGIRRETNAELEKKANGIFIRGAISQIKEATKKVEEVINKVNLTGQVISIILLFDLKVSKNDVDVITAQDGAELALSSDTSAITISGTSDQVATAKTKVEALITRLKNQTNQH